jgi:hypothetical protein
MVVVSQPTKGTASHRHNMKFELMALGAVAVAAAAAVSLMLTPDAPITGRFYETNSTPANTSLQNLTAIDLDNSTHTIYKASVRLPAQNTSYNVTTENLEPNQTINVPTQTTKVLRLNSSTNLTINTANNTFRKQILLENQAPDTKITASANTFQQNRSASNTSQNSSQNTTKPSSNTTTQPNTSVNQNSSDNNSIDSEIKVRDNQYRNESRNQTTKQNTSSNQSSRNSSDNISLEGLAKVGQGAQSFHIFKYEASRNDSNKTSEGNSGIPVSRQGVEPWNEVSRSEAARACGRKGDGFRLPTRSEWRRAYRTNLEGNTYSGAASLNANNSCTISNSTAWNEAYCLTGTGPSSWSTPEGIADLKGNLWEWTSSTVTRELDDGSVDLAVRAGGKWSTGEISEPFIADRTPDHSSPDIGFRCVYDE